MPKRHSLLPDYNIKLLLSCGICFRQNDGGTPEDSTWPLCTEVGAVRLCAMHRQWGACQKTNKTQTIERKFLLELKCPFTWELSSFKKKSTLSHTHTHTHKGSLGSRPLPGAHWFTAEGEFSPACLECLLFFAFDDEDTGSKPAKESSENPH